MNLLENLLHHFQLIVCKANTSEISHLFILNKCQYFMSLCQDNHKILVICQKTFNHYFLKVTPFVPDPLPNTTKITSHNEDVVLLFYLYFSFFIYSNQVVYKPKKNIEGSGEEWLSESLFSQ